MKRITLATALILSTAATLTQASELSDCYQDNRNNYNNCVDMLRGFKFEVQRLT